MTQEEAGVYMLGGVWRASSPLSGLCSDPAAKSSVISSSLPIDAVAMRVLSVSSICDDAGPGAAAVRLRGEWSMKAGTQVCRKEMGTERECVERVRV